MTTQTQGDKARLLQLGINAIAGQAMKDYSPEYPKIFTVEGSEKAYEIDVSVSNGGLGYLKPEGTEIRYAKSKQDFTKTYTHKVYALGARLTFEAMMNNKYENLAKSTGTWLKKSMLHTYEQLAADVINVGYTSSDSIDGLPLFSTAHLLGTGGTFSNRFTSFTSLSQSAIEDAIIELEDFRDGAGLLADIKAESLHIPRQLRFDAMRIDKSSFEPDSTNTATINPIAGYFSKGIHVNHRFTSSTDWFIKTNAEHGFKIFDRMKLTFEQDNVFNTGDFCTKAMFYASFGHTDPRCAFGSGT